MKIKSVHMYMLMFSIFGLGGISILNQALLTSAMFTPPGGGGGTPPVYTNYHSFPGSGWVRQIVILTPFIQSGNYYYDEYTDLEKYWSVSVTTQTSVGGYSSYGIYRLYINGKYSYYCFPTTYKRHMVLTAYFEESTGDFWCTKTSVAI